MPKLYNGTHRRALAQGNRNSTVTTYASPRIKALLAAMPPKPATLVGKGSVAHAGTALPVQYTVGSCKQHGQSIGNGTTMLGGLTKGSGYVAPYYAKLGNELLYCNACRSWVLALGHHAYVPMPAQPKQTIMQAVGHYNGRQTSKPFSGNTTGNAITGERV